MWFDCQTLHYSRKGRRKGRSGYKKGNGKRKRKRGKKMLIDASYIAKRFVI